MGKRKSEPIKAIGRALTAKEIAASHRRIRRKDMDNAVTAWDKWAAESAPEFEGLLSATSPSPETLSLWATFPDPGPDYGDDEE